jgi:Zn-dependent metalloprotease
MEGDLQMKGQVLGGLLVTALVTSIFSAPVGATAAVHPPASGQMKGTVRGGALPDQSFGPAQRAAAIAAAQRDAAKTARSLKLSGGQALRVKDVVRDRDGSTHVRYERTYRGLPVVGGDFVLHRAPNGRVHGADWASKARLSALRSLQTRVSLSAALATAKRTSHLSRTYAKPRLTVWALGHQPRLAWKVVVAGRNAAGPGRDVVYVDARTGTRIAGWSEFETSDATGTGNSLYAGAVTIHTDFNGASYAMRDLIRGNHRVITMNNSTVEGPIFTDADDTWGNGAESDPATVAVDAQYGAAQTWDFYNNVFGRLGIRGDGVGAYSRVHYSTNYDNAFWNDTCFCMTYGDGNSFTPLVSLDVAGHEMSHGVTSNTAGLLYFGESGGLNEATSDIFGTMVEFSANNSSDAGDYYIGEKITPFSPFYLRRMDNPHADGASFNCWQPLMGRSDVHYTSGVANHFYYMLAEGTGPKTIGGLPHNGHTCNGTTITGIGRVKAEHIWYRALTVYMTSGTDYRGARDATIRAARDLYGPTSAACQRVVKTWNGVNVGQGLWACSGQIGGPVGPNVVKNPGFEAGNTKWTASSGVILNSLPFARSGVWFAYLNGFTHPNTQTLKQKFTVPNQPNVRLSYYLLIDSERTGTAPVDTLTVQAIRANGNVVNLGDFSNTGWDDSYHRRTADLSSLRGLTITLKFTGVQTGTKNTGFLIDDVAVNVI